MGVIEIKNLTRDYGNGKGIFDVSFSLERGETFGFLGPNGAGKTTAIRHLMGFLRPKSGSCTIDGLDCFKHRAQIQRTLGYISGEIHFFDDMPGTEYLKFIMRYRGEKSDGRMKELLERFELDPKNKIKKMSKGMKQKIGIVAAFMHDPELLILDEPSSGLDPLMQNRFVELIIEEKTKGKTILMSSHKFDEVERTCHRIGIIREGKIVAVDRTDALRRKHVREYAVTLDTPELAAAFVRDFDGTQNETSPLTVTVTTKHSLEEIFMQYYGGEGNA